MYFEWKDYIPEKMGYVENWLDNSAIHASQKTFEKAGFVFDYENEDGDTCITYLI